MRLRLTGNDTGNEAPDCRWSNPGIGNTETDNWAAHKKTRPGNA